MMDVMPKAMQSLREEMRQGRGDRLTVSQFRVLAGVNRGVAANKDLGELLGVSEAAISRMVDHLVQDGLIKKSIHKSDRRQSVLSLTIDGSSLYNFIRGDARQRLKEKLEVLPNEKLEIVIKGLEILKENIDILS